MQYHAREIRELRKVGGAEKPEPRDSDHGQKYGPALPSELNDSPRLGQRIPIDLEAGIYRGHWRNTATDPISHAGDRDNNHSDRDRATVRNADKQASCHGTEQDGHEGSHADESITADQLIVPK